MSTTKNILNAFFATMQRKNLAYCILHTYDNLPETVKGDIDFCADISETYLDTIMSKISNKTGGKILLKSYYGIPNLVAYDVYDPNILSKIVQIDFHNDNIGVSWLPFPRSAILKKRIRHDGFFVPETYMEFLYSLTKRIRKQRLSENQRERLRALYMYNTRRTTEEIKRYLGSEAIVVTAHLLNTCDTATTRCCLDKLLTSLIIRQYLMKPWKLLLVVYFNVVRACHRAKYPTGIFVSVLSPDGGGKTSVSKAVLCKISHFFREIKYLHWRPGVLPKIRTIFSKSKHWDEFSITRPPVKVKSSRILSSLRWLYYSIDYIVGYYLRVLPMKIRTAAVIIDRYYYDIIADPMRYGFNLPQWVIRIALPFIPKPDLTIFLDNKPGELQKRKPELHIMEITRQIEMWREFIPSLPNARIVTTDKHFDYVVADVIRIVLDRRAELTRKLLRIDPDASFHLWRSDLSGNFVALPSKANCRWIVPVSANYARKAWDLYLPYGTAGRLTKRLLKWASVKGALHLLQKKRLDLGIIDESEALRRCVEKVFDRADLIPAISTGTPGPYRKITMMIQSSDGTALGFIKIGESIFAKERIRHEARILRLLSKRYSLLTQKGPDSALQIFLPECLYEGALGGSYLLVQSAVPFAAKGGSEYFNADYADIIRALAMVSSARETFVESAFFKKLEASAEKYPLSYRDLLRDAVRYLKDMIQDKEVEFALSHGDFTPWNTLWSQDQTQCFLFDWESACLDAPVGIDLVHFLFQIGFLLKKYKGKKLLKYLLNEGPYEVVRGTMAKSLLPSAQLVLIYLLQMAMIEDREQVLSKSAVERRKLIKVITRDIKMQ